MKRIYLIIILIWIIGFTTFIVLNSTCYWVTNDTTNLIMGGIAMFVSLISLAIADRKKPYFKGEVLGWQVAKNSKFETVSENMHTEFGEISLRIVNSTAHPINGLIISFRLPSELILETDYKEKGYDYVRFKDTLIITSDKVRFLGNAYGDNNITFEHHLRFQKMGQNRKVYVTVAGDNISPTTYSLTKKEIVQLKDFSSNKPYKLKRVVNAKPKV